MHPRSRQTAAALVAEFLLRRGVRRLFGLQGGHIQPIWDRVATSGIDIIDVRDEGAAVHMAHAHAELTNTLGVAMVTAGPGVTNTITAIANASIARVPVLLIGGAPPRMQERMGPLQGIDHVALLRPATRYAVTARNADHLLRELDAAVAHAFGDGGEPGPVFVEIPTDVVREEVPDAVTYAEHLDAKPLRSIFPDPHDVTAAAKMLWGAQKPLIITGRGARGSEGALIALLDALGALYLDTQESRGLVPPEHPSHAGAVRARAMRDADVVLVIGRKLDYQLGYGSPVAFANARFVRISDTASELIDNRRGAVELLATPRAALEAIVTAAAARTPACDRAWVSDLAARHRERVARSTQALKAAPAGGDGAMHPNSIFAAIAEVYTPDTTIAVSDGGDILSFARLGLSGALSLDAGAFGCLGVGVPYAIAAKLAFPDLDVVCVTGDGALGFNAMEIDTAVRHAVPITIIVANNAAWNIERHDQITNYEGRVVGTELRSTDYAALARALGAHGERIERAADLADALRRARKSELPALIDVVVTRDAVSSDAEKGLAVVPDYQALTLWSEAEKERRARA